MDQPVIILPPGKMSDEDKDRLRGIGLCVVECEEPDLVRFMEPPVGTYEAMELALIELSRKVLGADPNTNFSASDLSKLYVQILLYGTKMEPVRPVPQSKCKRSRQDL